MAGGQAVANANRGVTVFNLDPLRLIVIGHDTKDGPEHPDWAQGADDPASETRARNFLELGVMSPIHVRKDGRGPEAPLIVTQGRGRTKDARLANEIARREGLREIEVPVVVDKIDDALSVKRALAENYQRKTMTPIDRAAEAHRAITVHHVPIREVADSMGTSVGTVQSWLAWYELAGDVQKEVRKGRLSFSAAVCLADLPKVKQTEKAAEMIASGKTSMLAARQAKIDGKRETGQNTRSKSKSLAPSKKSIRDLIGKVGGRKIAVDAAELLRYVLGDCDMPENLAAETSEVDMEGGK